LVELPVYAKKVSGSSPILLTINGFDGYGVRWTKLSHEPDPFGVIVIQEIYHKNESNKSPEEIFNKITSSGQEAIMFVIFKDYFIN
jgi:hypothetical protein